MSDTERLRLRDLYREVRRTVLEPHPFNKQTCCRDCRRKYNRRMMRKYRGKPLDLVDNYTLDSY